jgi:chromosome segregation ATPase
MEALDAGRDEAAAEVSRMAEQLATALAARDAARDELAGLGGTDDEDEDDEVADLREHAEMLQARLAEVELLRFAREEELAALQQDLAAAGDPDPVVADLREQLAAAHDELELAVSTPAPADDALIALEAVRREAIDAAEQRDEMRGEIERLRAQLTTAYAQRDDVGRMAEEHEAELQLARAEIGRMRDRLEAQAEPQAAPEPEPQPEPVFKDFSAVSIAPPMRRAA